MTRRGKLSARWNRAFIVLLGLSVATAVVSVAVVQQVEASFAAATDEVTQETAMYDRLVGALTRESALAHALLDSGSSVSEDFLVADQIAEATFAEAAATYDAEAERDLVGKARTQWDETYPAVRDLALDASAADAFAADTSPKGDIAHFDLAAEVNATGMTIQQLDQTSRGTLQQQLDRSHATTLRLLVLLGGIFALSVFATVVFARRMAKRVVHPIQHLRAAADRFGAGDLDHRVELSNDDEIGELAERFNAMADTIASTHRHLTVQAHHDVLTGLVNRAGFIGHLDKAVDPLGHAVVAVSLMFLDLDDFKHVNDNLGHAAGDDLLRQVADRLRAATRSTDVVCRLGGDEFAILVGSPSGSGVAVEIAERVLAVLDQPFSVQDALIRIGASIGIASQLDGTERGDQLLRAADVAMYAAKGLGKHRWELFDPEVHGPVSDDASSILDRLHTNDVDAPLLH